MDIEDERQRLDTRLSRQPELSHIRVKKHGASLNLVSGPNTGPVKHAKLTHIRGNAWGLSLPLHTGRWEPTPFTGTLEELVHVLRDNFPDYLAP